MNTELDWKDATKNKPEPFVRVILKIKDGEFPVVGFLDNFKCWCVCTQNISTNPPGVEIVEDFVDSDVTHYAEIGELPV